uniref:Uncharacterized protein n=1 Tax=viral metagenome TaxID=1070528 RepID=A0A6C0LYT1_9ZZZZ
MTIQDPAAENQKPEHGSEPDQESDQEPEHESESESESEPKPEPELTLEEETIKRNLKNHDNTTFKDTNVYKYIVGEKPRGRLNILFGGYYTFLHSFFVIAIGYLILFDNNMTHLVIGLLIMSLDGYANVVLHDCPLSMVENKYLEKSGIETRLEFLRTLGIMYSADNKYDIQLETIINAWTLISGKILMLMCLRNFTSRSFV